MTIIALETSMSRQFKQNADGKFMVFANLNQSYFELQEIIIQKQKLDKIQLLSLDYFKSLMAIIESSLNENMLALLCIVVISVLGFVSNGLSLHITITNSNFHNAYGILCTAVLLCNIQTISIIMIWGAVVLLT
ncbi:unnamed protein product [Onchocerca flexuosa]|uniref:7TM_GPCR_Srx domain-containing protein n=1 Tax=Onchocerca flexuosa TaxID=387005 RepID=A0A183HB22_9BILA|nr:unnamed protein product [Onchocerca flexuosa]